jgi:hypothetical protein
MKSKSKFHKKPVPKFSGGGFLDMFGQGANAMGGAMPEKQDPEAMAYMAQYNPEVLKQQQSANQTGEAVESAVGSMGPWGAAIAGVSKMAGKAFGPDAYGDYKDNAGGKTKEFFNRSFNIKEGVAGLQDTFKRPTADNIKSQLTLGLWGKSEREKDAEKMKRDMDVRKSSMAMSQSAMNGAIISNSIPKFSAPRYGRNGMKFQTTPSDDIKLPSDFSNKGEYDKWYKQKYGRSQYDIPKDQIMTGVKTPPRPTTQQKLSVMDTYHKYDMKKFQKELDKKYPATYTPPESTWDLIKKNMQSSVSDIWNSISSNFEQGGKLKHKSKFYRK